MVGSFDVNNFRCLFDLVLCVCLKIDNFMNFFNFLDFFHETRHFFDEIRQFLWSVSMTLFLVFIGHSIDGF